MSDPRLDQVLHTLLAGGHLTQDQLRAAQGESSRTNMPLLQVLEAGLGAAGRSELRRAIQLSAPASPSETVAPPQATREVPQVQRVGEYELERELGRGGMGIVYVARHLRLGRRVALKLMTALGDRSLQRFQTEAEALAQLSHPGIVSVHELGLDRGRPYLVMALVEGESLEQRIGRGRLADSEAATLTAALARALGHAHEHSILHRDIKPANVLIDRSGQPLLTDFGLARNVSDERERLTRTGQVLGTPAYMSPEQANGELEAIDQRSDIYSLGATLYAMLTGRPPFQSQALMALIVAVLTHDPQPPPDVDSDLQTICLKCLSKRPADRYDSASELVADLERFLAGEPVQGRVRRAWKGWRLWPVGLAACVLLLVGLALLLGVDREPESQSHTVAAPEPSREPSPETKTNADLEKAHQYLDVGLGCWKQGQKREALVHFDRAFEGGLSPEESIPQELQVPVAWAYCELGDELRFKRPPEMGRARTAYDRAIRLHSKLTLALFGRGHAKRSTDPAAAVTDLREALSQSEAYWKGRPRQLSITILDRRERSRNKTPQPKEVLESLAETLRGMGDLDGALGVYDRGVLADPNSGSLRYERGQTRAMKGDLDGAIADFTAAFEKEPSWEMAAFRLAQARRRQGRLADASRDLDRALRLDPKNYLILWERGEVREALGDKVGAARDYQQSQRIEPRHKVGEKRALIETYTVPGTEYLRRGRRHEEVGNGDVALASYDLAIEVEPSLAAAWCARGRLRYRMQDRWGAYSDGDQAVNLDPQRAEAWMLRGLAREWLEKTTLRFAIADYSQAIRLDPHDPLGWYNRGYARLRAGDPQGSSSDTSEAVRLRPDFAWAHARLGAARLELGSSRGAVAAYTRAIELKPGVSWFYDGRARAHEAEGNIRGATRDYERVLQLEPDHAHAKDRLAVIRKRRKSR